MSELSIHSLGGLTLTLDGIPLDERIIPLKAQALLLYVCCQHTEQPREKLATLFWSEASTERAAHNQRMALMRLREHLAPHVNITRTDVDARARVDADAFVHALNTLCAPLSGTEAFTAETRDQLIAALAMYRGDFLANVILPDASGFHEWADAERESLRQRFLRAADRLINLYIESAHYADGTALAQHVIELRPAARSESTCVDDVIRAGRRSHVSTPAVRALSNPALG